MILGWFKKKPTKYAVATLVANTVIPDSPAVSPLRDEKETYIKYLIRLKQAMVSGNMKMQTFLQEKYLPSKGLTPPTTLKECDQLIQDIENWL